MTLSRRTDIFSSHVRGLTYNHDTGELAVDWDNGSTTVYGDVPKDVAEAVMGGQVPSIGEALHQHVRGKYDFVTKRGAPGGREGGATR